MVSSINNSSFGNLRSVSIFFSNEIVVAMVREKDDYLAKIPEVRERFEGQEREGHSLIDGFASAKKVVKIEALNEFQATLMQAWNLFTKK